MFRFLISKIWDCVCFSSPPQKMIYFTFWVKNLETSSWMKEGVFFAGEKIFGVVSILYHVRPGGE